MMAEHLSTAFSGERKGHGHMEPARWQSAADDPGVGGSASEQAT
jgi:hypothetical protein